MEPQVLKDLYRDLVVNGSLWKIELFLRKGANPNIRIGRKVDFLSLKADDTRLPTIKVLLSHGVTFGHFDGDAIVGAVRSRNVDQLEFCLRIGVNIDTRNKGEYTALGIAARSYGLDIIEYLLGKGADVHAPQGLARTSVLHLAVAKGDIEVAGLLLDRGADINLVPPWGSTKLPTPLAVAATKGKREMAEYLIGRGADEALLSTDAKEALAAMFDRSS